MNPKDLLIQGGRVIDPAQNIDDVMDILLSCGRVAALGKELFRRNAETFDAHGLIVMPGLIDLHTHLREPGAEEAETIASGCAAALWGGFTAVCPMPNTEPPADDSGRIHFILERARGCATRVYPVGAITRGRRGEELAEMGDMARAGAVAFSDDGNSVANAQIMVNALRYARMVGKPLILHEEDRTLCLEGQMNESALSEQLGLKGMPRTAEDIMVMRDIALAEYTGAPLHITHISTRGAVEIIRAAKARHVKVTCDVTPHHLTLTEDLVASFDTRYKINPPLRTRDDIAALRTGLAEGVIDAIATDHAPHYPENKEVEFTYAAFGVTGLETALAVIDRELVRPGFLTWGDVARKMSFSPSRILGVEGGSLEVGAIADVTLYNPEAPWKVDPKHMKSRSSNTAFFDWELPGRAAAIVVGGALHKNQE
ncbi:MAG: dihydroorotase [Candidatus Latescibacter sp.]|nr:dihydroorotase [Candidatus Latescibacter sp.]